MRQCFLYRFFILAYYFMLDMMVMRDNKKCAPIKYEMFFKTIMWLIYKKIIDISYYSRNPDAVYKKYCALSLWQPILKMDNVLFVNLQYGARAYDLDVEVRELGIDMVHWDKPNPLAEFDNPTALIAAMDMIITINNTLAHQESAIGISCYVIVVHDHHWYYASLNEKSQSPLRYVY